MKNNETRISGKTEIKGLTCEHLEFIPASQFKEWDGDHRTILIYTRRINGRNYKVKRGFVGAVTSFTDRKKGEQWQFRQADVNLVADTVGIIFEFLKRMNGGMIKLDLEKGELINE